MNQETFLVGATCQHLQGSLLYRFNISHSTPLTSGRTDKYIGLTMITGRTFILRKKKRKTDRTRSKKEETELRNGIYPTNTPAQNDKFQTYRNERLTVISTASNKRRHSCPRHWCFEKLISHQLGLSMPN